MSDMDDTEDFLSEVAETRTGSQPGWSKAPRSLLAKIDAAVRRMDDAGKTIGNLASVSRACANAGHHMGVKAIQRYLQDRHNRDAWEPRA